MGRFQFTSEYRTHYWSASSPLHFPACSYAMVPSRLHLHQLQSSEQQPKWRQNSNLLPVLLALSNENRSAYSQNAKLGSTAFSPAVELLSRCNTNSTPRKKERKKRHTTVGPVCGGWKKQKIAKWRKKEDEEGGGEICKFAAQAYASSTPPDRYSATLHLEIRKKN